MKQAKHFTSTLCESMRAIRLWESHTCSTHSCLTISQSLYLLSYKRRYIILTYKGSLKIAKSRM